METKHTSNEEIKINQKYFDLNEDENILKFVRYR